MKPSTRKAIIARSERAIRELHLNAVTDADKTRLFRLERALHALDDEQAEIKYTIEDLLKKYKKKSNTAALVAGLERIVALP